MMPQHPETIIAPSINAINIIHLLLAILFHLPSFVTFFELRLDRPVKLIVK